MASQKMEEFLKKPSPETLSQVQQAGQTLQNNGAETKPMNYAPQAPAPVGQAKPNAPEPKNSLSQEPSAPKHENAVSRAESSVKSQAQEQGQNLQKNDVKIDHER